MKHLSLYYKILIVFSISIGFTILFASYFLHFLYTELYLENVKESIVYQGKRTASHFHYGELNDEIIQKIQWYNVVSEFEVIVVDDLEELSSYFPYKVNYETLIHKEDRHTLEKGQYVLKKGYVQEFNREILGAIFPIKGESQLIGFIYIYVPLATVMDVFSGSIPIIILVGASFFVLVFFIIHRIWKSMFAPLETLRDLALEVSKGNYEQQVITDRNDEIGELTKAFNEMSASLAEQEKRKRQFTSDIAHELRTPLTYISGYTVALKEKIYSSPDEARHYLEIIEKETERLNKLIHDMIDLNHLQDDIYTLEKEPIPIAQLLLDALDFFDIRIKERNLQIDLTISEDLIVLGDAKRIYQVFFNTIDNAIKYSYDPSTISISLQQEKSSIVYHINNRGMTIDKEDLPRMGERFFRTDQARNRKTGGTGLGLSIVKEIVRLHGGSFHMTSDEQAGTSVYIHFPSLE